MPAKIYKLTNTVNGKGYIGFTTQSVEARFRQHCSPNKTAIHSAIKKYGKAAFTIEVLHEGDDRDSVLALEETFIREHHTHISEHGYNRNFGGAFSSNENRPAAKWTSERHIKMSAMFRSIDKSYMQTEAYKESMRSVKAGKHQGQGNPLYGRRGPTNPKSQQHLITYPDGRTEIVWGGEEKRHWLAAHKISPNTFQKMIHQSEYQHPSGIRIIRIYSPNELALGSIPI